MLRRLLILAFVALALLGLRSTAYELAATSEAEACCPCEDEGGVDDGCCADAQCQCVSVHAATLPERAAPVPRQLRRVPPIPAWVISCEQRARDRHFAPPTRPPIG